MVYSLRKPELNIYVNLKVLNHQENCVWLDEGPSKIMVVWCNTKARHPKIPSPA
jgi:hypothetical protein